MENPGIRSLHRVALGGARLDHGAVIYVGSYGCRANNIIISSSWRNAMQLHM